MRDPAPNRPLRAAHRIGRFCSFLAGFGHCNASSAPACGLRIPVAVLAEPASGAGSVLSEGPGGKLGGKSARASASSTQTPRAVSRAGIGASEVARKTAPPARSPHLRAARSFVSNQHLSAKIDDGASTRTVQRCRAWGTRFAGSGLGVRWGLGGWRQAEFARPSARGIRFSLGGGADSFAARSSQSACNAS
jgi:hypothetical protein